MSKPKVPGSSRGTLSDAAEAWLRKNDPFYVSNKRKWMAPTTDALSRALSELNRVHPSLADKSETVPRGNGCYAPGHAPAEGFTEDTANTGVRPETHRTDSENL